MAEQYLRMAANNQSFYELAWFGRMSAFFDAAAREGRGNLYRTLKAFEALDDTHDLRIRQGIDAEGKKWFKPEVNLTIREQPARTYADILSETRPHVDNRKIHITFAKLAYDSLPLQWLVEIARDGFDAIVELGAGYGRNLIEMYCRGTPADMRYIGAEFTQSGCSLMKKFFAIEPSLPFATAYFDHMNPDTSFVGETKKLLVFTRHSIEQVEKLPETYFDVLARAAPHVVGIHFEPIGFQFQSSGPLTQNHIARVTEKNFNLNMFEVLKAAEKRNVLAVRYLAAEIMDTDAGNPTSVVLWDNPVS